MNQYMPNNTCLQYKCLVRSKKTSMKRYENSPQKQSILIVYMIVRSVSLSKESSENRLFGINLKWKITNN